jgi:hypothetical protein
MALAVEIPGVGQPVLRLLTRAENALEGHWLHRRFDVHRAASPLSENGGCNASNQEQTQMFSHKANLTGIVARILTNQLRIFIVVLTGLPG